MMNLIKPGRKNILLFCLLLLSASAYAQSKGNLEVRCRVLKDHRGLDGAEVKIYKNAGLINRLVTENGGKFTTNLDFNNNYLITVSFANCYNKSIEFATQLPDKDKELVFKYPFSMDMVELVQGTSPSDFTKPIAKVAYNTTNSAFEIDEQYTKTAQADFNKKIEAAQQKPTTPTAPAPATTSGAVPVPPAAVAVNHKPVPPPAVVNPVPTPAAAVIPPASPANGGSAKVVGAPMVSGKPKADSSVVAVNTPAKPAQPPVINVKEAEEARKKAAAEEKARKEAELKAKKDAEEIAHKAAADKAKHEAEEKIRLAEEEKARKKTEAEEAARAAKIAKEKEEAAAIEKTKKDAEDAAVKKAAEEAYQTRLKAEKDAAERARKDAELKATKDAELKRQLSIEEQKRMEAVAKAQKDAELKAQNDAEARARREAEERMRIAAEAQKKSKALDIPKKENAVNSGKAGIVEETVEEKNRTIKKTTITGVGNDILFEEIDYTWGGVFYFKNKQNISKDVYDTEIANYKGEKKE